MSVSGALFFRASHLPLAGRLQRAPPTPRSVHAATKADAGMPAASGGAGQRSKRELKALASLLSLPRPQLAKSQQVLVGDGPEPWAVAGRLQKALPSRKDSGKERPLPANLGLDRMYEAAVPVKGAPAARGHDLENLLPASRRAARQEPLLEFRFLQAQAAAGQGHFGKREPDPALPPAALSAALAGEGGSLNPRSGGNGAEERSGGHCTGSNRNTC